MCVSFHLKQEWGGQPFFPGTGALDEIGEYQVTCQPQPWRLSDTFLAHSTLYGWGAPPTAPCCSSGGRSTAASALRCQAGLNSDFKTPGGLEISPECLAVLCRPRRSSPELPWLCRPARHAG